MKLNRKQIQAASGAIPADIVIRNGQVIDVFNLKIIHAEVAITDGLIVGIGGHYEGETIIDAKGRFVAPGLIDAHVHIESSMTTPSQFAKAVLPHGVTTVIADPHEIANVSGVKGIQFMLDDSEQIPLDVRIMLPSCVPATPFEQAGAILTAHDLRPFYNHPRVLGLAEVMDFPSVKNCANDMIAKLADAKARKKIIDGHGAGLDNTGLNIYRTAGISTDHECTNADEALERIRRGFYVMIREGSAAKNMKALLHAVTPRNSHRFLLCTDDKHLDELLDEGSIDASIRLATNLGLDPLIGIQMGSINAAQCFGMFTKGAIAPGYDADFLLLDSLEDFRIFETYVLGQLVARQGQYIGPELLPHQHASYLKRTLRLPKITREQLQIPIKNGTANVIGIIPNSIVTDHLMARVNVKDGYFLPCTDSDFLKLAVIERHHGSGKIGLGIVKGFGLKTGAVAATIAHDSHNLMVTGTNDRDILTAIQAVEKLQGGIAIVADGQILASLPLPIGGLMSDVPLPEISNGIRSLSQALIAIGFDGNFDFLLTLAFLSLPVIPSLKLTSSGLFDVMNFEEIRV